MRLALWLVSSAILAVAAVFMARDGFTGQSVLFAVAMTTMILQLRIVIWGAERLPSRVPAWRLRPDQVRYLNATSYITSASLMLSSVCALLS